MEPPHPVCDRKSRAKAPWHGAQIPEGTVGLQRERRHPLLHPCWHHQDGEDIPPSTLHQGSPGLSPSHAGTAAFPAQAGGGDSAVAFIRATVLQEDVDALLAPRSAGVEERRVPHGVAGLHIGTVLWREERVLGRLTDSMHSYIGLSGELEN